MNWWKENWFTSLPNDMQRRYHDAYNNKYLTIGDIRKLASLPIDAHRQIQRLPISNYSKGIENIINQSQPKTFMPPRAKSPKYTGMNTFDKLAIKPLSNMARAAKNDKGYLNVIKAGVNTMPGVLKDTSKSISYTIFGNFFNYFQNEYFNTPIRSINPKSKMMGTCSNLFCIYALGQYMATVKTNKLDFGRPTFQQNAETVVREVFIKDAPYMAENIWTARLNQNLASTIISIARNTLFSVSNAVQSKMNLETYRIILPLVKNISYRFNYNEIIQAISTFNFNKFGGKITDNTLDFGWRSSNNITKMNNIITNELREAEIKIRDNYLLKIKNDIINNPSSTPIQQNESVVKNYKSKTNNIVQNIISSLMKSEGFVPSQNTLKSTSDVPNEPEENEDNNDSLTKTNPQPEKETSGGWWKRLWNKNTQKTSSTAPINNADTEGGETAQSIKANWYANRANNIRIIGSGGAKSLNSSPSNAEDVFAQIKSLPQDQLDLLLKKLN